MTTRLPCAGCDNTFEPHAIELTVTRTSVYSGAGLPDGTWHYCLTCAVIAHAATRTEPLPRQPYTTYAARIHAADARPNR